MLNCLAKTTTMSLDDFLKLNNRDQNFNKIKNGKLETAAAFFMAIVLHTNKVMAAGKGIDPLGNTLLDLIRHWAYWILIIMCIVEIVRAGIGGDSKKILSIIMRYLLIFMAMYLVPSLFDTIKDSF